MRASGVDACRCLLDEPLLSEVQREGSHSLPSAILQAESAVVELQTCLVELYVGMAKSERGLVVDSRILLAAAAVRGWSYDASQMAIEV